MVRPAALLALFLLLFAPPALAQTDADIDAPPSVEALDIDDDAAAIERRGEIADERLGDGEGLGADHGGDDEHADDGHGAAPPVWLVIPFVVLLLMIATGPLFYAHFWHHNYPKIAIALGLITAAYYLLVMGDGIPILHAAEEYFAFIALLGSLYVASGCILIKTDFAGTPKANTILLLVGGVLANFIGTTGASMLLIRPYMRLNAGRLKAYHIIFFIFIVSNVGGALTPIGDPPLFLGFLRGVPFFWTVAHVWYIWLPTILAIAAVFYVVDGRNKEGSLREGAEQVGIDVDPGEVPGGAAVPEARGVQDVADVRTPGEAVLPVDRKRPFYHDIAIEGKVGFAWLAVVIAAVFIDPKVIPAIEGTIIDLHHFGLPFGIREVIMGAVAFLAYRTANKDILKGNDFNFEPIKEVGFLFIGIFLTMQPALTLIGAFASENASALGVSSFYFGTGVLSGVLDNAPTYVSFLSAAMGKFGMDVNIPEMVRDFAVHPGDPTGFYLQAISVASVFWGALTYIGNGPNFMVKAIAESSGVDTPSFVAYMVKYSIPILVPIYIVVWLVFFSGWVLPHPDDVQHTVEAVFRSSGLLLHF
ncbi:sodium:proton antiporter [Rubrivirga litoralis]|uniref:Sodium:proton antiporter n=1 Tax=Rubrivirga litoralis TaxID=3075598 RepID=A0ABU3BNN3_9BACT|nr:sodium:proton antiporter [Rubrivirga sp. F394]MDT0630873.1 sodium:proton antiporter [Rubrivirga sp. F394]